MAAIFKDKCNVDILLENCYFLFFSGMLSDDLCVCKECFLAMVRMLAPVSFHLIQVMGCLPQSRRND